MKNISKITQKAITYQIPKNTINCDSLISEEILYWYEEFAKERDRPPEIFELIDKFEKVKIREIKESLREDFGYAEIMFEVYKTEDPEEIAKEELQDVYRENEFIVGDLISELYMNLNLSLLYHERDYGLIDYIDFSSKFPKGEWLILGAQVPVFRTLKSNGSGKTLNDEFYGGE